MEDVGHLGLRSSWDTVQESSRAQYSSYSESESIWTLQWADKRGLLALPGTLTELHRLTVSPHLLSEHSLTQVGAALLKPLVCFLLVPHVFVFVLSRQRFQRENEPLQIDCSISHAEDVVQSAIWFWSSFNPCKVVALASWLLLASVSVWSLRC